MKTADLLKVGEKGIIQKFLDETLSVKLLEMGFLPGSEVKLIRTAPFGCPLYLKVGKNFLALRRKEAVNVILK
ncbi:FeoA family protein [Flexithrix dorotheae]|uniref:FeoA family protein n=1 Tax=Flexithrix dorotheae TaxID=70993 RepID=UPI000379B58F|nr:FeoA family protein [Flexithrix dorotheae]